jgi:hypothetical protein
VNRLSQKSANPELKIVVAKTMNRKIERKNRFLRDFKRLTNSPINLYIDFPVGFVFSGSDTFTWIKSHVIITLEREKTTAAMSGIIGLTSLVSAVIAGPRKIQMPIQVPISPYALVLFSVFVESLRIACGIVMLPAVKPSKNIATKITGREVANMMHINASKVPEKLITNGHFLPIRSDIFPKSGADSN